MCVHPPQNTTTTTIGNRQIALMYQFKSVLLTLKKLFLQSRPGLWLPLAYKVNSQTCKCNVPFYLLCNAIHLNFVLHFTLAAHCVTTKQNGIIREDLLEIFAGLHQIRRLNASHVQKRKVIKIINHKNFDFTLFESDLALLKLDREVRISHYVKPVCLPEGPR